MLAFPRTGLCACGKRKKRQRRDKNDSTTGVAAAD